MGYEASLTIEPTKAPTPGGGRYSRERLAESGWSTLVLPCSAILPGLASRESWENTTSPRVLVVF